MCVIMENPSTHDIAQSAEDLECLFPAPNVTSIHQPMDAGVIAALMRRHKRRFLAVLVRRFPLRSREKPPRTPPDPQPARPATPPTPPPLDHPPPSPTPPRPPPGSRGFHSGNDVLWVNSTAEVLHEYGAPRIVGGFALPLFLVTSWRFRSDTDTSWVATTSPKGPLRSAKGRTKGARCHTTTQPHCAFICLPYLFGDVNFICHLMGGTKSADAIRESRHP